MLRMLCLYLESSSVTFLMLRVLFDTPHFSPSANVSDTRRKEEKIKLRPISTVAVVVAVEVAIVLAPAAADLVVVVDISNV